MDLSFLERCSLFGVAFIGGSTVYEYCVWEAVYYTDLVTIIIILLCPNYLATQLYYYLYSL